ncbi:MAG: sigma 54-interacting transcriptional regulator [Bryobacteraceae bacterium]|nr:sigma 54-interacting transcriptional regulator [Bryobacteraceae bacterium]
MSRLLPKWKRPEILEAVFDQISDALVLYDPAMHIVGANRAAERLFAMSGEMLVGRHCHEVFHCQDCRPGCGVLVGLEQAPSVSRSTVHLRTTNGHERIAVMSTQQLFDESGRVEVVVAVFKDITEEFAPQRREIIAESPLMRSVVDFTRKVAASEATTILLEGENGTGKDVIAKTLHYESLRSAEPFVAINCAAIPETLLESELFGYEKGAFTDARSQKKGIFELADRGTLFLDEVSEMPMMLQAKLLRVLEDQTFRRLGGLRDIRLNMRVLAASNRNLYQFVEQGNFRQDLYFRLNVIHIVIPPLRDRREDIIPLSRFFVEHYNRKFKRRIEGITPDASRVLLAHDWPGNVRELRNAVERAMILEDSPQITAASLPLSVAQPSIAGYGAPIPAANGMSLYDQERRLLAEALEKTGGNQTKAAQLLEITRDTLRYKMKKFQLR